MFSFDLSAIDMVLLVAVLVLFVLQATRKTSTSKTETQTDFHASRKQRLTPTQKYGVEPQEPSNFTQPNAGYQNYIHQFGYLKDLPRNTPVPPECFGCPQVMQCLFPNE